VGEGGVGQKKIISKESLEKSLLISTEEIFRCLEGAPAASGPVRRGEGLNKGEKKKAKVNGDAEGRGLKVYGK